ncbi:FAD-binding oxidoreductase [Frankia sp. QA3]|uniref:NAD(P)/FAD-dependent oxidoreductase n=1 Tax=Frankia sp. QA3 TaxID=710111 RepID=UPI000269C1A2|nr:FAD-dependent oxidoreductase [Frankia sp. QA3]EIV92584.1 glycine/D-amino acid oxidase, deaminating [Frankia sp. QA3]
MPHAQSRGAAAEIAVIGAGVHGASAAFHLARRGLDVVVFEQGRPAGGPTGRSSGICRAYYTQPFLARVAHDSIAFLAGFAEHTGGGDAGFVRTGGLYLHGPDDVADARRTAATLVDLGIDLETLDADEVAGRFPGIDVGDGAGNGPGADGRDGNVAIAVREEQAGYADPYRTTWGFVTAARAHGALVHTDARVVRIAETPGQVELTTADGTTHRARRLLLAAGPWTAPLAAQLGITLPLHAERHVVAVLGPACAASAAGGGTSGSGSARRGAPAPGIPGPDADAGVIIDVAGGDYAAPQPDGGWLLGGLDSTPPVDPDTTPAPVGDAEFAQLAEAALRRRPGRPGEARARAGGWSAFYDVSPDWQPVIGQITDRVWVDAGTSGHGFKLAPVLGDHVAGLLAGEQPAPGLAAFSPSRFTTGDPLTAGFGTARILG